MSTLADTNILPRRTQPDHSSHMLAVNSVAKLPDAGETVHFTLQNISEFWNVATRRVENNGLGFTAALASGEVEKIERLLTILPESPAVYAEWKRLVLKHGVLGSTVYDVRLVATMNIHGVPRMLTFNIQDFARY